MNELPLNRDGNGEIQLAGTGAVTLRIVDDSVIGTGGHVIVFLGEILGKYDSRLIMKVAIKVPRVAQTPLGDLRAEAERHVQAWMELSHVLRPFGFLAAHDQTGSPAALVMEIGMPLHAFLAQAGPLAIRHITQIKAIARLVFQLLQFIVSAVEINFLHMDIKMTNMFVVQSHNLEMVKLAVGDFGSSQRGEEQANGTVFYRSISIDTWDHTSPRMVSAIYNGMISPVEVPFRDVLLDSQLCFYNDLYGWARIAVPALVDRFLPERLSAPTAEDYAVVPQLGHGDVLDAVHHLMLFALDLLTPGRIEDDVNAEYVNSLHWYDTLPDILAGEPGDDGAAATAPNTQG